MKKNEVSDSCPIHFKDKIDEYLWKEHHIIGGCCSSVESVKYSIAREVVEKLTDTFIDKAENYLRNKCQRFILTEKDIEDFKTYIKGE